jgi:DNA repair exonuclease SbcCD ATPase subunit
MVERLLGLGHKAFTTSVLLRQGEADKLFSASRDERIAVLKGIIGFERFEEISGRVHAATLCRGTALDTLRRQLLAIVPVTPEELAAAEAAVADAERAREDTRAALTAAAQRVEQAKRWEGLETKRGELEKSLADAAERAAGAAAIRATKARLDDLAVAVPELEAVVKAGGMIASLDGRLAGARDALAVCELARDIARDERLLAEVGAAEGLEARLKTFAPDLDEQLRRAVEEEAAAEQELRETHDARTRAETRRDQARDRQRQFAEVAVGVPCSRCGQPVGAAHAERERAELAKAVRDAESDLYKEDDYYRLSRTDHAAKQKCRKGLEQLRTNRDQLASEWALKRAGLRNRSGLAPAHEIHDRLAVLRQQWAAKGGVPGDTDANRLDRAVEQAQKEVQRLRSDRDRWQGQEEAAKNRLSDAWRDQLPAPDADHVADLVAERDRLIGEGIAEKLNALERDKVQREVWSKQLDEVREEIGSIATEARIPEREAERIRIETASASEAANKARDSAVRTRDELKARAEQREGLTAQVRAAEREHDLHRKLDDLLGQNGLQRELVRDAELQIVALANDTLQHLSDGDLSLEPDDEAAGRDDKAFALRVRRAGDPLPIGVLFLSGSQKFRVAVSVALAVGRFARGRARPLEAVIIDEGFGSLDKDGLRAMADELKRLQRTQDLRRVILVSHQEEFTDQFPVGYRLSPGENGTTAAPFRR